MMPVLQIGSLSLQVPGVLLIVGLWLALELAERTASRFGVDRDLVYKIGGLSLLAGVLGARVLYALAHLDAFASDPSGLISLRPELFDALGGLITAALAGWVIARREHIDILPLLDAFTTAFSVLWIAIPLANLASGEGFGAVTTLPWGIELWGATRHPVQLYEAIWAALIFAWLWPRGQRWNLPGQRWWRFVALAAAGKIVLEAFHGDSYLLPGNLRAVQAAAWLFFALALWQIQGTTPNDQKL